MPLEEDIVKAYRTYYTHGPERPMAGEELRQFVDSFGKADWLRRLVPLRKVWRSLRRGRLAVVYGYVDGVSWGARVASSGLFLQPLRVRDIGRSIAYLHARAGGRLLDVGCGDGRFLLDMRELGWAVEGVEVDARAAEEARKRGLSVRCGQLAEARFEANSFDAIVINHALEHVHDPEGVLRECHRILRSGGVLRVFVPNAGGLGHRRFGRNWLGLDPPRHLYQFTLTSLGELARRAGYEAKVSASAAFDRHMYRASFALASEDQRRDSLLRTFRLYALDYRNSLGTLLGKDWGEEIALEGRKR